MRGLPRQRHAVFTPGDKKETQGLKPSDTAEQLAEKVPFRVEGIPQQSKAEFIAKHSRTG
jgi:hypothetical protein